MDIILYILIGLALFFIIICIGLVLSKCNDDDYIWIQNLILKVVEDKGGIEAKFRSMNY